MTDDGTTLLDHAGVFATFGALPPATLLTEDGLARLLGRECRESIKRAVERGELPLPVRLMGKPTWTAGTIVRFIEERLQEQSRNIARHRA